MTAGPRVDVAIIGSGFSGTLLALALRRRGRSVALVEAGRHPRFAIGESSTPLANLLLEEIAAEYDLPRLAPLAKWSTWRRAYPELPVGLKRGFSFFHHRQGEPFADGPDHARQLLVAASPHDGIADTHWYRADFDAFLAREAVAAGAELFEETRVAAIDLPARGDVTLDLAHAGARCPLRAGFVVDASGPRGALSRLLRLPERPLRWLPPTQALFTHFEGVARWDSLAPGPPAPGPWPLAPDSRPLAPGPWALAPDSRPLTPDPPFPIDDAALHHMFEGGWIWVLRFDNGITSAGAALTDPLAAAIGAADGAPAWERLLDRLPSVRAQFEGARPVRPFVHSPRLAYRSAVIGGPRWALMPSAAGVIDPLLSTGFPLTLLGIQRLASLLTATQDDETRERRLQDYAARTLRELDATERLVGALYGAMPRFPRFKRLALLYFAAAVYSETARRLGRPAIAPGFLLCDHPGFAPALTAVCEAASQVGPDDAAGEAALAAMIDAAIAPFDLAGLGDRSRRDWYPVLADDLVAARHKVNASAGEIAALLERCGFECRV